MSFERARSPENKQIRLNQIKTVAKEQLNSMPYHKISFSGIGKALEFDRANLYKYVKSKEEIFTLILIDEMTSVIENLERVADKMVNAPLKDVADLWINVITAHPMYLEIVPLSYSILEKNTELQVLVEFNKAHMEYRKRQRNILKPLLPDFSEAELDKLLVYISSFTIGHYPKCIPSDNQKKASELAGNRYKKDFTEDMKNHMIMMINGIRMER